MGINLLILPSIIYNHFFARFVTGFLKKMQFLAKFRSLAQKGVGQVMENDEAGGDGVRGIPAWVIALKGVAVFQTALGAKPPISPPFP